MLTLIIAEFNHYVYFLRITKAVNESFFLKEHKSVHLFICLQQKTLLDLYLIAFFCTNIAKIGLKMILKTCFSNLKKNVKYLQFKYLMWEKSCDKKTDKFRHMFNVLCTGVDLSWHVIDGITFIWHIYTITD